MRISLWPQSLFGRLIAASLLALLMAQVAGLVLVARERERFILQGSVREWSRRIAEVAIILQGMDASERTATTAWLSERPWRFGRGPPDVLMLRRGLLPEPNLDPGSPPLSTPSPQSMAPGSMLPPDERHIGMSRLAAPQTFVPFSMTGDFERTFEQQLQATLGEGYAVKVVPTADATKAAISISGPLFSETHDVGTEQYDAAVKFPDGYRAVFRVTRLARGAPLPRGLFMNLALLVIVMAIALFVTARSITQPLSDLARAADSVGRDLRQPKLAERGARELRHAARAFNTMQDRMQRYLDSRSRVLAAMSHDLKTPLTRLRLQVEMLEDSAGQARISKQLDEMEGMVHGALALFRGLDDNEAFTPVNINELVATLRSELAELNGTVTVEGYATRPILGKAQALRRCLTNLIGNALKFGSHAASVLIEDGPALVIRIRDDGPGIPEDQLEKVFEPFYRLESSRNRDTGGTGLGLSIARDVVQSHGGSLLLKNRPVRGLEAIVTLPRA